MGILSPLLSGAQLVMAPPGSHQDAYALINAVTKYQITTLQLVPSMLRLLLEAEQSGRCQSLRRVFCGGETLSAELQERCSVQWGAALYNLYGPTEATIDATWWACEPQSTAHTVPIGRPIANVEAYVLDALLQPTPIGIAGELYLGGAGLARGYCNRPAFTAAQFLPHPFSKEPGARLYKTGDMARYQSDGSLVFLGRRDTQVKLRGVRMELSEIEAVLRRHPAVRDAVLVVREDTPDDQRLIAYLSVQASPSPAASVLRHFVAQYLPSYMVPTAFIFLETIPVMPNGKVDRRALPVPDSTRPTLESGYVAPRDAREHSLVAIWSEVLGVEPVGIHDNFFALGGHSLLATRIISRLCQALQVEIPLRALFEAPTIVGLVEAIEQAQHNQATLRAPAITRVSRATYQIPLSTPQVPNLAFTGTQESTEGQR